MVTMCPVQFLIWFKYLKTWTKKIYQSSFLLHHKTPRAVIFRLEILLPGAPEYINALVALGRRSWHGQRAGNIFPSSPLRSVTNLSTRHQPEQQIPRRSLGIKSHWVVSSRARRAGCLLKRNPFIQQLHCLRTATFNSHFKHRADKCRFWGEEKPIVIRSGGWRRRLTILTCCRWLSELILSLERFKYGKTRRDYR